MEELENQINKLIQERDEAISLLAWWVYAVSEKGSSWDDWDEYYKNAWFRPTIVRELIDKQVEEIKKQFEWQK